ncbi:hypothetical protein JTB14_034951 [Gonioctena quinquepunctata]|nr:hypothetical protein JTB14_034951 [Gonioctena quinquepunctata]
MRFRECWWFSVALALAGFATMANFYTIPNKIHFPYTTVGNPYVGMFVAIAVPLDLRGPADVFMSMNFEGSYALPQNQTTLTYPPIISSSSRKFLYDLLERKLKGYGYPGKPCLKRAICEAAEYTTKNLGVLGDLLHILLTPSSSKNESSLEDYAESEEYGRTKKHCKKYKKACTFSALDLISVVRNKLHIYKVFD